MRHLVSLVLAAVIAAAFAIPAAGATNTRIPGADRFGPSSTTLQAIVVSASTWSTSYATVTTWERTSASTPWTKRKSGPGRVGYSGMRTASTRMQSSGETPAGMFGLGKVLTPATMTGVKLPQKVYDSNDYWVYDPRDPSTYNTIQPSHPAGALWRTSEAERLMAYKSQYSPAIVINYNLPTSTTQPNTSKGGGIFLHVNGSGATAGCVSVPYDRAQSITRWLDPAKNPRIIIGEDGWLNV